MDREVNCWNCHHCHYDSFHNECWCDISTTPSKIVDSPFYESCEKFEDAEIVEKNRIKQQFLFS